MSKLDRLQRELGSNIDESMGAGSSQVPVSMAPRGIPAKLQGLKRLGNVAEIPLSKIDRDPRQPREEFDEESLDHLAQSLKARGQLQPIRVRWDEEAGVYRILCGERRWRAAQRAGLDALACVMVEGELTDSERLAIQLIENLVREDLKPIEQARAFHTLMESHGWSAQALADELRVSKPTVLRALALLKLPESVQDAVEEGSLPPATAYEVSKLPDQTDQAEVVDLALSENLTRSEVIDEVRRRQATPRAYRATEEKGRIPRQFRLTVCVPDGRVTVELDNPYPEVADVLSALLSAPRIFRRKFVTPSQPTSEDAA